MEEQPDFTPQQEFVALDPPQSEQSQLTVGLDNPLREQFQSLSVAFSQQVGEKIRGLMRYREDRSYHMQVSDKGDYFSSMWQHLQRRLQRESPNYEQDLLGMVALRQENIVSDIMEGGLQVEVGRGRGLECQEQQKSKKVSMLREQSTEIQRKLLDISSEINQIKDNQHQTSESRFKAFEINQGKVKEYEQFLRKQKREKEQRAKVVEQHRKREEEGRAKRQQQEKEQNEKALKQRKAQLLRKVREGEQKRVREKLQRQQRSKQYKFISKSLAEQPPLFKQIQKNYHSRYQSSQNQRKGKALTERHSLFQAHDAKALQEHERKYEELRSERDRQRRERLEEFEKIMELQQGEVQTKFKSNFNPDAPFVDHKQEERKVAHEKKERIKRYIEETVKERYLPRIDEEKRREFLKMIEDLGKKRVKKVRRQDGSVEYEEVRPSDPRMMGLQYLEKTKEMASKMRGRRKNSDHLPEAELEKPKVFDYLGEKRKKGTSMSNRDRLGFMNRKGMSFDEKVKKVELQSQKLQELARQKEMKLKYGKFGTSEQILQHKQEIDQHYMDIINMKLRLINFKEE